ncbi:MAG: hypothetical protein E2600_04655 [Chryseobacterium sp.]|jgi:hypothetical protein|nr:hypothetical protein [Chryseobacterium sp.]
MKITKQVMEDPHQLIGKTKEEIYALLGTPDYSEFEGTQLIYITRSWSWFRRNALILELDPDEMIVESTETVYGIEIPKAE